MSNQTDESLTNLLSESSIDIEFTTNNDLVSELEQFRTQWQQELLDRQNQNQPQSQQQQTDLTSKTTSVGISLTESNEKKAGYLFDKGVLLEQEGRLYEAIKFYRMAMQLDPDIEFKISSHRVNKTDEANVADLEPANSDLTESSDTNDLTSMYEQFQALTIAENRICQKENENAKGAHISDLPVEVMIHVLKWVVSSDLDLRSLDNCALVSKGFYVCARDSQIWKLACEKVWRNETLNCSSFGGSWRNMYIKKARLNFDGCYISKASYIRSGEQSLDGFYRPWHLVEYYRYLRFFPDGTVLMLTTPEEPKASVQKIKPKFSRDPNVLRGQWSINSTVVSVLLLKKVNKTGSTYKFSRRGGQNKELQLVNQEQYYNLKFELNSVGKRINFQLNWIHYDIHILNKATNTESSTNFEITKSDFPSFYYSRVKSFTSTSDSVLK